MRSDTQLPAFGARDARGAGGARGAGKRPTAAGSPTGATERNGGGAKRARRIATARPRAGAGAGAGAQGAGHSGRRDDEAREPRASLYDDVTRRIVAELEAGRVPWVQPWGRIGGAAAGLPRNAVSDRAYSGINVLILWGAVIERGYRSQAWLTFRQALDAGGAVRKGERGTTIVYADRFTPESERTRARDSGDRARTIAFLKRFTVFNVAQIDGLPDGFARDPAPLPERAIVPVAERVIAASGVAFHVGGDKAFYVPALDIVQVPPQPAFFEQINYYRTALHELTHATGHPARLDRKLVNAFGSKDYAREELVAEMGSAFLCAALGIAPTVRHADYLGSWLAVLREDSRAIFRAASAASKAADWLLARHAARDAAQREDAA
ncbi:ArdC family protein [Sphingomonas sp.]|jgi:antirestriction protein ArdC|uniref:ArdC family protein n=1 Tax=Sphingomonas sp. TaxID=28214 RepID=UPI002E2F1994|nr:zincin-like metallopeptidase domain-containing protein [Sphingomonas sp.]HEX4693600.1 zincin-like metallopeptidase domain-containing protein [Sphingomonas sp.]